MNKLKVGIILCIIFITIFIVILINLNNKNVENNIINSEMRKQSKYCK